MLQTVNHIKMKSLKNVYVFYFQPSVCEYWVNFVMMWCDVMWWCCCWNFVVVVVVVILSFFSNWVFACFNIILLMSCINNTFIYSYCLTLFSHSLAISNSYYKAQLIVCSRKSGKQIKFANRMQFFSLHGRLTIYHRIKLRWSHENKFGRKKMNVTKRMWVIERLCFHFRWAFLVWSSKHSCNLLSRNLKRVGVSFFFTV